MLPRSSSTAAEGPPPQEYPLNHMTTRKRLRPAVAERVSPLEHTVTSALEDMKAVNVRVLDVRGLTDIADTMIIASGNSDRHVRSIAERITVEAKAAGFRPLGSEGTRDGEWVLVDLQDVLVHVMLPRVREFYGLERLWEGGPPPAAAAPTRKAVRAAPAPKAVHAAPAPKDVRAAPRRRRSPR